MKFSVIVPSGFAVVVKVCRVGGVLSTMMLMFCCLMYWGFLHSRVRE